MVFENNYFGYAPGAGIHFYIAPAYAIVRYNIFNGLSGANRGNYGILVGGSNIKVYNNTFYGYGSTGGVELYKNTSQNNEIKNNLFLNNTNDIAIDFGGSSYPTNNTVNSNYFGSSSKCLNCTDQTGAGGPNYSAFDDAPPNVYNTSPWTQFSYTFNKASTGTTTLQFFNGCGGGAFPTSGTWYLDDISIITQGGGVEKVTNGNMEGSFTSGVASGWTVAGGASGTQETGVVHSGSNSQKLNVAGGCGSRFEQSITLSAGNYVLTGWAKRDSSTATLTVYVAGGNSSFTIGDNGITFLGSAPYSTWNDFKINPLSTDLALVTDSALNLGSDHQYGLNSASTSIIPGTINQNQFGGGWDFGAFVYNNDTVAPSTSDNSDANTHTGPVSITLSCTDGSGSGCANTYYTTDGSTPTTLSPSGTNFTLSGDGTYTIKYFSVDNAGNTESVKTGSHQVIINSTAPSVAPTGVPIDISERPVDCPAGFVYCIDTGPNRKESLEFIRNDLSAPGVSVFISQDSTRDDIHMDITRSTMQNLLDETPAVPFPWSQGLNIASEIIRIKTLSAFNGYPIKTLIKPGTIILPYDETKHKNIPVSQLRIAWYNSDTRRWTVLQNNTVFDDANKTLSNTTTHLYGYFTVVYGSKTSSSVTNTGSDRTLGTTTKIKPSPTGKAHKMHTPLVPQTTSRNCILKFCW